LIVDYFKQHPGGTLRELVDHHDLRTTSLLKGTANKLLYRGVLAEVGESVERRFEVRR
jgi:hypothetical protein